MYFFNKKSKSARRSIKTTAVVLIFLLLPITAGWFFYGIYHLHRGIKQLNNGNLPAAARHFLKSSVTGIFPEKSYAGAAFVSMFSGNDEEAIEKLGGLDDDVLLYFDNESILQNLLSSGNYKEALHYSEFLMNRFESPFAFYFGGIASLAMGDYDKATDYLLETVSSNEYRLRAEEKLSLVEKLLTDPGFSWITDRFAKPIDARFLYRKGNFQEQEFLKNILPYLGLYESDLYNFIKLAIDTRIQNAVEKAIEEVSAIAVVTEPSSGDILAAALSGSQPAEDFLLKKYDPGFLINITIAIAAAEDRKLENFFPLKCRPEKTYGNLKIYDEAGKSPVNNVTDALVSGCCEAFAELAAKVGKERLKDVLKRLWFDRKLKVFNSSRILASAYLADGNIESMAAFTRSGSGAWTSPLHLALISSAVASDGVVYRPRILLHKAGIEGGVYYTEEKKYLNVISTDDAISKIKKAFIINAEGLVQNKKISAGLTTFGALCAYSGGLSAPFSSIAIGFIPAESPQLAFSMIILDDDASMTGLYRSLGLFISMIKAKGILK